MGEHRERGRRVHDLVEAEPVAVEVDRSVDVVDDVADADCRHVGLLVSRRMLEYETYAFRSDTSTFYNVRPASMSDAKRDDRVDPRVERSRMVILEAAVEELAEVGYGGVTIESVAARAGVGKSTIYRHWPDKLALIADAFETFHVQMVPDLGDARRASRWSCSFATSPRWSSTRRSRAASRR